jgi:hypothetical protein
MALVGATWLAAPGMAFWLWSRDRIDGRPVRRRTLVAFCASSTICCLAMAWEAFASSSHVVVGISVVLSIWQAVHALVVFRVIRDPSLRPRTQPDTSAKPGEHT